MNHQFSFRASAVVFLGGCLMLCKPTLAKPQGPAPQTAPAGSQPSYVSLRVTVLDTSNRLIDGLTRDSFHVTEDGKPRDIIYFSHDPERMSVMLLVDKSGSMYEADSESTAAVMTFVRALPPDTDFSLIRFNERAVSSLEHITNFETLEEALKRMPPHGHTALLDAIYLGLSEFHDTGRRKRVLVAFSDGEGNIAHYKEKEIQEITKESETEVFFIAPGTEPGYRPTPEEISTTLIDDLCALSGAQVIRTEKTHLLPALAENLAQLLEKQYVIGIQPSPDVDRGRKWRKVTVRVDHPHGTPSRYAVTRAGYLAGN